MIVLLAFGVACLFLLSVVGLVVYINQSDEPPASQSGPPPPSGSSSQSGAVNPEGPANPASGPASGPASASSSGSSGWRKAMLTCFNESHNFASENTDPTRVNVVAVHERHWPEFRNKRLELKLPTGVHTVEVRDYCDAKAASCNTNIKAQGNNFLIDINHLALQRLWPGKSCSSVFQTVEWRVA